MSNVIVQVAVPPWGTCERTMESTGITRKWLEELVSDGLVRKRKHNEAKQGRAIYCIADVIEYLGRGSAEGVLIED